MNGVLTVIVAVASEVVASLVSKYKKAIFMQNGEFFYIFAGFH